MAFSAPMTNALARLLAKAREDAGLTLQQAADRLHVTNQAINQWERGKTVPSPTRRRRICELYEIAEEDYRRALNETYRSDPVEEAAAVPPATSAVGAPNARIAGPDPVDLASRVALLPLDVPVMGVTVGGEDADFEFNGATVDHVRRPPGLANARRAYATYVVGQSMYPAHREGSVLYVNPDRPASIGDDVVIELYSDSESDDLQHKSGKGYIKRLVRRTPTKIVVEQFNPPGEIEFDRERVKSLHRVVPWDELLSI